MSRLIQVLIGRRLLKSLSRRSTLIMRMQKLKTKIKKSDNIIVIEDGFILIHPLWSEEYINELLDKASIPKQNG